MNGTPELNADNAQGAPVVEEVPVRLLEQGKPMYEWRCTPTNLEALVLGRLYSHGAISNASIAQRFRIERLHDEILVHLDELLPAERPVRARVPRIEIPSAEEFAELFRELFAGVDARHQEGGMHAAALVRHARITVQAEDVGRHNAVDKVIGRALLAGEDLAANGMLVSSRVSGEIARKAAHSTIAWLASRSIPTTLAVSIARFAGMPIIGRAAGKNAWVYR